MFVARYPLDICCDASDVKHGVKKALEPRRDERLGETRCFGELGLSGKEIVAVCAFSVGYPTIRKNTVRICGSAPGGRERGQEMSEEHERIIRTADTLRLERPGSRWIRAHIDVEYLVATDFVRQEHPTARGCSPLNGGGHFATLEEPARLFGCHSWDNIARM